MAVGQFYMDFSQIEDDEVIEVLRHRHSRRLMGGSPNDPDVRPGKADGR